MLEVREVHYLLVEAVPSGDRWETDRLETVPRGGKLELQVSKHDKYGREFSDSSVELSYRPSRFDLVRLSGQTAGTAGRGWTVIRLWDRVTAQQAWLTLRVGEGLQGATTLTVGDLEDYDSYVGCEGRWETDSPAVLDTDSVTGLVVALRAGTARLTFSTASGESQFSRQVSVGRSEQVSVDTSKVVSGEAEVSVVRVVLGPGGSNNLSPHSSLSLPALSSLPLDCEASWDLELSLQSVFTVSPQWTGDSWACVFTRVSAAPPTPATITLRVLSTSHTLQYLPAISVSQTSLEVGETGGVVRVSGHPAVLDLLQTRHTEGLEVGRAWVEGEELSLPVSLTAQHYSAPPAVTVSVPATGQSVSVTILPLRTSCSPPTGFLSALAANLIKYYQTVLCIILASLLAGYITKTQLNLPPPLTKPAPPPTVPGSPDKAGDTSQSPSSPYLWTVDNNPIYGSPIYR